MTEFVRIEADRRIVEVDPDEARRMITIGTAGATATMGIVQFLLDWTHPTSGRQYKAGEYEKFHDDVPAEKAIADKLKAANIARPLTR
jgi:hypothetical protein